MPAATLSVLKCNLGNNVAVRTFTNRQGLKLKSYLWRAEKPLASIVFFHGLRSHTKFSFLNHTSREQQDDGFPRLLTYEASWVEAFNKHGYNFCSFDLQGHGESDGWDGTRCNFEMFDDLAYDGLQFMLYLDENLQDADGQSLPIFCAGISMGGGISARVAQLFRFVITTGRVPGRYTADRTLGYLELPSSCLIEDNEMVKKCEAMNFRGVAFLCPNFLVSSVANWATKGIITKLASVMSYASPHIGIVPLKNCPDLPWVNIDRDSDEPLTGAYTGRLPARIVSENIMLGRRVQKDASLLFDTKDHHISILFIHGTIDQTTNPGGSINLAKFISTENADVDIWLLKNVGHHIIFGESNYDTLAQLLQWCSDRLVSDKCGSVGGNTQQLASA